MYEAPIVATGEVLEALKPGLFRVSLPNGKPILGHLSKELKESAPELQPGDMVSLELTPFDFDSGRIAGLPE